jgi:hypothetical protein
MRRFQWTLDHISTTTGCWDIKQNVKWQVVTNKKCWFLTFCLISQHPVIVGGRFDYHSTRLDATIWMSYKSSFYNHWIINFCFDNFNNFDMSKLFRHFGKLDDQCQNVKTILTISACQNSLILAGNFRLNII